MVSGLEPWLEDLGPEPGLLVASGLEDVVCSTKLWPWLVATEVYPGPDPAEWGEDPELDEGRITSTSVSVLVTTVV